MITILYRRNNQSVFHSFYPIFTSKYSKEFRFTTSLSDCLEKGDRNKFLIVAGIFKGKYQQKEANIELLKKFKSRYERVIFWDESDGADSLHVEFLPYVDHYFKKQILKDKNLYLKPAYGEQQFSDYYYHHFNVKDNIEFIRQPAPSLNSLGKLDVLWNIGASIYPFSLVKRKLFNKLNDLFDLNHLGTFYKIALGKHQMEQRNERRPQIQARFGYQAYPPSIGFQRKHFLERVEGVPNYLTGRVAKSQFQKELKLVSAVLSPFGYGEICHRDFEAIIKNAVVLKPDMGHILTFPNVYLAHETYIPVDWSADDLFEMNAHLEDHQKMNRLAANAFSLYMESFNGLDEQVERLITITINS